MRQVLPLAPPHIATHLPSSSRPSTSTDPFMQIPNQIKHLLNSITTSCKVTANSILPPPHTFKLLISVGHLKYSVLTL
jgi:hypothetical protein